MPGNSVNECICWGRVERRSCDFFFISFMAQRNLKKKKKAFTWILKCLCLLFVYRI